MADKRRSNLRDEVSASLAGLDDLAAELAALGSDEAGPTEAGAGRDREPTLDELDPDMEASLAEVRELAGELGPADVTEPEAAEPEVPEPEAAEPEAAEPEAAEPEAAEPEVPEPEATEPEATGPDVANDAGVSITATGGDHHIGPEPAGHHHGPWATQEWAVRGSTPPAPDADEPTTALHEPEVAAVQDAEGDSDEPAEGGSVDAEAQPPSAGADHFEDTESEAADVDDIAAAEPAAATLEWRVVETAADVMRESVAGSVAKIDTGSGAGESTGTDDADRNAAAATYSTSDGDAAIDDDDDASDADLTFEAIAPLDPATRDRGINAITEAGAASEAPRRATGSDTGIATDLGLTAPITEATMPTARADGAEAVIRPWSPAAAMEPVPPLAPPPARPLTPLPDVPAPRLPAEGGKKMNILPIVMIGLFLVAVVALIVVVVHQA